MEVTTCRVPDYADCQLLGRIIYCPGLYLVFSLEMTNNYRKYQ